MKVARLLILLAVLVAGLIVGALNSQEMTLKLGFTEIHSSTGLAITVALLAGVLIGAGLVLVGMVIPLYSRLRMAQKAVPASPAAPVAPSTSSFDGR
ncbi:LapA family protein [Stenotrophomonas oahuensis]|uniref:LapA family protein n=1 Tax=Stenotrophomonas oahuensis TaxID=3003271 RepID=A0ABY9YM91_9GAMM|nr:LapA family protein [Stenotrophomonas sp. A5586]WNH51750.1 LapA family protein [Stenotrophomonas sp. A5586]